MMKSLVVFYSRTGNTKKVAEAIADKLKCDIEEISATKNRKGVIGYLRCGREAMLKKFAEIKKIKNKLANYDFIIIGTPIWGGNMSGPIRTFLNLNKNDFKKVAFFCSMGGSGNERAFNDMEKIIGKKPIAAMAVTEKEVADSKYIEKVNKFVAELKK